MAEIEVEFGDPHNDQMAARSNGELDRLLRSVRKIRAQHADVRDESALMAVAATGLIDADWDKAEYASVLAAALLRITGQEADGG